MKVRIKNSELVRLSGLSNFKIVKFAQLGLSIPKYIAPLRADEHVYSTYKEAKKLANYLCRYDDWECDVEDEPLFMLKVIQYGFKYEIV